MSATGPHDQGRQSCKSAIAIAKLSHEAPIARLPPTGDCMEFFVASDDQSLASNFLKGLHQVPVLQEPDLPPLPDDPKTAIPEASVTSFKKTCLQREFERANDAHRLPISVSTLLLHAFLAGTTRRKQSVAEKWYIITLLALSLPYRLQLQDPLSFLHGRRYKIKCSRMLSPPFMRMAYTSLLICSPFWLHLACYLYTTLLY